MAHVLLDDTKDWELVDSDQDLRGWEVRDANGNPVGTVGGMAVDTERAVVDTIILTDGSRFRAEDVSLDDGVVYVTTYGAPAGVATRAYTDAHGVRRVEPPEVAAERSEARREIADAQRDAAAHGVADFAAYDDDFRSDFRGAYGDTDLAYDDLAPAYRAGYDFAYDDRYADRPWDDAEADLREAYYRRHGYPMSDNVVWSRVKGAVRHAYDRVRGV